MITKVEIENYKSIRKLTLELGRLFDNDKASKTVGCLAAATNALRDQGGADAGLHAGERKFVQAYARAAKPFAKAKQVGLARRRSASLDAFVTDLEQKALLSRSPHR